MSRSTSAVDGGTIASRLNMRKYDALSILEGKHCGEGVGYALSSALNGDIPDSVSTITPEMEALIKNILTPTKSKQTAPHGSAVAATRKAARSSLDAEKEAEQKRKKREYDQRRNAQPGPRKAKRAKKKARRQERVWTIEEDEAIGSMQAQHGNNWTLIAAELGAGRLSDEIKKRWGWLYRAGLVGGE